MGLNSKDFRQVQINYFLHLKIVLFQRELILLKHHLIFLLFLKNFLYLFPVLLNSAITAVFITPLGKIINLIGKIKT
jgi:hypothetical protein